MYVYYKKNVYRIMKTLTNQQYNHNNDDGNDNF